MNRIYAYFLAVPVMIGTLPVRAASGTWNGTQDAVWVNSANWSASPFPSGSQTATFDNAGNGRTALDIGGLAEIQNMTFTGAAVAAYTIGNSAQQFLLQADGEIRLTDTAANSQTINARLQFPTGNSGIRFRNDNPGQTLTFGKVIGFSSAGATKSLYFNGAGPITVQGDIDRDQSGLIIYMNSTNTLTLGGNVRLTQLNLDGTNAVVNLASGTAMTFSNGGGANLIASQDATINGPGTLILSQSTGDNHADNAVATDKTLTINARLTGATGFEYWHSTYHGTVSLNGINDYTLSTVFNAAGTIQCAFIGNKLVPSNLGAGTNIILNAVGCRLLYTGAGETSDRIIDVRSGGIIEHAGTGPLVFTSPISATAGAKTLVLRNFAAATGEFSGPIRNDLGTVSVTKEGSGTWILSAANTYSGTTAVYGGTLLLTGTSGAAVSSAAYSVSNGATLLLNNTVSANNTNRLCDTGAITLFGGTLVLANDGGAADTCENAGPLTAGSGTCTVSSLQAPEGQTSILSFKSLSRDNGATLNFAGTGLGESDRNRIFITDQPEGLIGAWATVNGTQTAYYDSVRGVCVPTWATAGIAARGPDAVVPDDATADVRITEPGISGAVLLAGDPTNSIARLTQCATTSSVIATASKTLRAYGIGIATGQEALTLGENVGDGRLTPLTNGGTLVFDNESTKALTVNAALANNASAASFAKDGPGDVIVAGPALHTGSTIINSGSLIFGGHDVTQRIAGVISGSGTLVKTGTNLLDLIAANTFTGPMLINQGVVRVAVNGALGTADSGTVIADGATLDVGGALGVSTLNLQSEPITVSGTGTDGQGAIVNSSANEQWYASGQVALNGDTTFGGTGRWDIRDGSFKMNDHTLTKKGNAWFALSQTVVTPGGTNAAIDVQAGTLRVQRQADLGGNSDNTLHLRSGTSINFYDVWSYPAWRLICENNTSFFVDFSSAMPRNVWYGPVVLNGTLALTSGGGFVGGFAGNVSGTGALIKNGAHTFYLTGTNNTYSGTTIVSNGTLCAQAPGSLPGYGTANRVTVAGGATLIVATGDGTTGFTAEQIRSVNTCTKFLTNTAVLGIDTTLTGLDIPGDLPGFMSLAKLGTNTLSLSGTATNLGNLAIYQGLLALDGTLNQHSGTCYLEGSPSSNALLRINAGASLSGSGDFSIRNNGAFYMDGGTFTRPTSLGFGERFALGFNNGGYGYLKMSGGTLTSERIILGTANNTTAGYGGIGIARFTGGTASFSYIPHFGSSPGSIGVLTVDAGGTFLKTGGECWLAYEGGRCEVNLTGGLFNNNGNNFRVGESGRNSATGIVNLCDGRFANAILNRYSGAFFMNFCGGTFAAGSGTPTELFSSSLTGIYSYGPVGEFAGGAVFDSTGRNVTVSSPIQAPPGQGVYAIALTHPGSGYIGEPYVQIRGGGGDGATAVADLTDDGTGCGTFKIARVTITCPGFGYTSEPTVTFIKGGANAVTAMGTASLAQNVSGGLTKRGAGILTLSGANTYTGTTTVVDGTLKLGVANALQTNTLISLAGGTLDLNGYTVTNAFAGTGLVTNGNAVTTFSPAGTGTLGTNTLTLADATVKGTYLADMTADGDSDRLNIGGPIDLSNIELHIVDTNRLNRHQTYTIMACMGTRTGTFKTTNLPDSHWHVIYQLDGTIKLLFTSGTIITIF